MDLQAKLQEAIKAGDGLARDLLRVILGEVSTRRARTGKEPADAEVHGIICSMVANNAQTLRELEQRGQTAHAAYDRLGRENAYLETLLPRTLDRATIRRELEPLVADLKAVKNDGQATGLAMNHLKRKGLAVLGEDVAAAIKELRAG
jgi:uncharacterized protein YqeY